METAHVMIIGSTTNVHAQVPESMNQHESMATFFIYAALKTWVLSRCSHYQSCRDALSCLRHFNTNTPPKAPKQGEGKIINGERIRVGRGFQTGTFLVNKEANKCEFWYKSRVLTWLYVDVV